MSSSSSSDSEQYDDVCDCDDGSCTYSKNWTGPSYTYKSPYRTRSMIAREKSNGALITQYFMRTYGSHFKNKNYHRPAPDGNGAMYCTAPNEDDPYIFISNTDVTKWKVIMWNDDYKKAQRALEDWY